MNNHKLHLLPLFILITGLVTLTASCKKKDMSLKLNEPRNIRGVVSYKRSFPDLNDKHLAVAQAVGICPPEDRDAAEKMKEQLIHITDNQFYTVDSLTHSIPYLVPRASELLDTIGSNFLDSLTAKGLNPNQIIVTSVLRSQSDVKRPAVGMEMLPQTPPIAMAQPLTSAGNDSKRWKTKTDALCRMSMPIP